MLHSCYKNRADSSRKKVEYEGSAANKNVTSISIAKIYRTSVPLYDIEEDVHLIYIY